MGAEENFGDKIGTGDFTKNPQNINRKGRPRKSFASINKDLRAKGVKPLTKHDLIDAYALIFNSTDEELTELKSNKKVPLVFRLIIKEMDDKHTRTKALADYRDYLFGKAQENIQHSEKELSQEERMARIDELHKKAGYMTISKKTG